MVLDVRAGLVLVPFEVTKANRGHFASLGCLCRPIDHQTIGDSAFLRTADARRIAGLVVNRFGVIHARSSCRQDDRLSKFINPGAQKD